MLENKKDQKVYTRKKFSYALYIHVQLFQY